MSRSKMFDPDQKIDEAMLLFWRHGYEATGMQSIVDSLGLSRGSLYATYGDKDQLWHLALRRYCDTMNDYLARTLDPEGDRPLLPQVERVLLDVIEPPAERPCGCLLTKAISERMDDDPVTAEIVHGQLAQARTYFRDAFARALDTGEIRPEASVEDLADFFLSVLEGLYVLDGARATPDAMRASVRVAMSAVPRA
jgi:TetR/AcrR family transcriptional regulator, transcriptional repressor for nem operon